MKPTDIRIESVQHAYEDYLYRTPIKFGGTSLDRVTLVNVECTVCTGSGKTAHGFGSMPLGNVWSFPSRVLGYDATLAAMKALAARIGRIVGDCTETGHPIDLAVALEPEHHKAAAEVTRELKLAEPIPPLCTLVAASAFDAAVHDAYGKVHGLNCYHTYGPDFLSHDLGHYLGREFAGETLQQYLSRTPQPRMPLYHLIGALDPIESSDIPKRLDDGLPETLPEWIRFNGLTHLKIKLNGDDLGWDVERVVRIDRTTERTQKERGVEAWCYSLDFNERCRNVGYLLEFLAKVREQAPQGYERIAYIEQPTAQRPGGAPRERHARGGAAAAGGDRRIVAGPGKPTPGPRDGLHRGGAEGVQGTEPVAAAGGGRTEIRPVPVRAGPDVSGGVADPLGGTGGARAGRDGHRVQRAPVRPGGEPAVGEALPWDLPHYRW